jgi:hypothetical protein
MVMAVCRMSSSLLKGCVLTLSSFLALPLALPQITRAAALDSDNSFISSGYNPMTTLASDEVTVYVNSSYLGLSLQERKHEGSLSFPVWMSEADSQHDDDDDDGLDLV